MSVPVWLYTYRMQAAERDQVVQQLSERLLHKICPHYDAAEGDGQQLPNEDAIRFVEVRPAPVLDNAQIALHRHINSFGAAFEFAFLFADYAVYPCENEGIVTALLEAGENVIIDGVTYTIIRSQVM
jgi:hypothetical protein